ncbi:efflux RND transporter periplasmic adaptor subunit [Shewanella corallii]|uniref:Efflux RND transporter periplasmic adaptor subunit n=1 Tax=Shewanella corallii TaxID=560080 RepID=A0ABT0N1X0_9GAMM|nr:efflux RND transporter periplasmic adaptor subunit [Shewanella corallii]MCL2912429.1 efflux RND transporter periplasmic adaptor subunit [Shewanella corallii]
MQRLLLICIPALVTGCGDKQVDIPPPDSRPAKLMTVTVSGEAQTRTFPAVVAADDSAVLTFRVPGQLQQLAVRAGAAVETGQVLAALDPQELKLELAQAQANYELAKVQYERMSGLRKDFVVSEQDFEEAESALNEAIANRDLAKANLGYATLHAPYRGTISLRHKENYEYVQANEPVMNIQTNDIVNVTFQFPERLLSQLDKEEEKEENVAMVVFDTYPDQQFQASLKQKDTEADPKTGSYKITLTLKRPENINVLPGMSTTVIVPINQSVSSSIPDSALLSEQDGSHYVWKLDADNRVQKTKVAVEQGHLIEGLSDGDIIVMTGVDSLKPGDKVTPWVKERGL